MSYIEDVYVTTRSKARIMVLAGLMVILWGRIFVLWGQSGNRFEYPPLVDTQITRRANLRVANCHDAAISVIAPPAVVVAVEDAAVNIIDSELALKIADRVLADYFGENQPETLIIGNPLLLSVPIFGEQRLVWSRLWLDASDNTASVLYVDGLAAVPALLYTDIRITHADVSDSCIFPTLKTSRNIDGRSLLAWLFGASVMLIAVGSVWEYRIRHVS